MILLGTAVHRHAELDRLNVWSHCQVEQPKRGLPETKARQRRKRGEERPF